MLAHAHWHCFRSSLRNLVNKGLESHCWICFTLLDAKGKMKSQAACSLRRKNCVCWQRKEGARTKQGKEEVSFFLSTSQLLNFCCRAYNSNLQNKHKSVSILFKSYLNYIKVYVLWVKSLSIQRRENEGNMHMRQRSFWCQQKTAPVRKKKSFCSHLTYFGLATHFCPS